MNPTYTGMLRYNRYEDWENKRRKGYNPNYILVEGTHEPIIDKEIFGKVEERIKMESKQPQWTHAGENILTGLRSGVLNAGALWLQAIQRTSGKMAQKRELDTTLAPIPGIRVRLYVTQTVFGPTLQNLLFWIGFAK